jgi:hypothetical protein
MMPSKASRRSTEVLREAEQHYIDALASWPPELGFNMAPARGVTWSVTGPAQSADGIPSHVSFNLLEIPDDALLTDVDVAAVGRWSTNTVAAWRQKPDHPLPWFLVAVASPPCGVAAGRFQLGDRTQPFDAACAL